ncbi:6-phosphogluconolactonase [Prosthecobacter fusiformis]|uniref:6-phosphogluconolactonase n=1 Tax=Prosthecobacter fusiformis TaxID=48464 RepID=A0A4R7RRJ3_9BACT|nr:lactonase family protein [Prosthecobacter fusiformis]TDU68140.1 6-phosphogluconolactonase [Prosthecobacter fusiformis]
MNRASLSFLFAALTTTAIAGDNYLVYFGCQTGPKTGSKGIYVSSFNSGTGELGEPALAVETGSPGFLAIHPNKKYLYAIGELAGGDKTKGGVSAFKINLPDGKLSLLNQVSSVGVGPCHVSVDKTGQMAMIANYGGGSVASYAIGEDGSLSEAVTFVQHEGSSVDVRRQAGPHAHSMNVSPDNRFAFACDLGLDKVLIYKIDPVTAKMTDHGHGTVPAGSGPRHLAFHPNGKFVFVNNEMLMTVTSFAYDAEKGMLTEIETVSTLPEADRGKPGFSTAETVVHPNGKFVYVSNRTHDTIAVFACDEATGKLKLIQNAPAEGQVPRNFNLDPSGKWMIVGHQNSQTAGLFKVDAETGMLTFTGKKVSVGGAICVRFLALEK